MSSFKRTATSTPSAPPGAHASTSSQTESNTSTGIPSLDDILGGGLPLSCCLLVLAPDPHSAYGELVQKYFIAQGLASHHNVCVLHDDADALVEECPWTVGTSVAELPGRVEADGDDTHHGNDMKVKIAWRYEQMKQFKTTVPAPASSSDKYCSELNLTARIPPIFLRNAMASSRLHCIRTLNSGDADSLPAPKKLLHQLANILKTGNTSSAIVSRITRISIPDLGSPQWGDLTALDILSFLHGLRSLLRRHSHACAAVTLPSHWSTDAVCGLGWTQKLGWLSDACITLSSFSADPSLSSLFPLHHGLVHIHTLPRTRTLLPPSDKYSALRGLASSASSSGGSGENNLAFKCTRKRLVFETLHLDLEGGVGERRTTNPTASTSVLETAGEKHGNSRQPRMEGTHNAAVVEVHLDEVDVASADQVFDGRKEGPVATEGKAIKPKKKVAFTSNRPELYDF